MIKLSSPLKIALLYCLLGTAWILASDNLLGGILQNSPNRITEFQNYKGTFFVAFTAILLYAICVHFFNAQKKNIESRHNHIERLDNIVESIADGFFAVDQEWKITHINSFCASLFGSSREQLLGENFWSLFPDHKNSTSYKEYERAIRENVPVYFEDYLEVYSIWFQVSAFPFKKGLTIYFRNITEQKNNQKALQLSKKNLDGLINNTTDLIWSIDKEFGLLSFNTAFENMLIRFGVKGPLKIGDKVLLYDLETNDLLQDWKSYYQRALRGERFSIDYQSDYKGAVYHTETSFNPILDEENRVASVGCFSKNITDRKKEEDERTHLIRKLIQQNKELEEFSFIASHNLRSPVASIIGLVKLYDKENPSIDLNKTIVDNIEKTIVKLDGVIIDLAQILDIRHRLDHHLEVIVFEELIDTLKSMLADQLKKTEAILRTDFQVRSIRSVKSYLNNILFNLLSNALKYTKNNKTPIISIQTKIQGDHILLIIKDNGIGIDLEKYGEKLFKPYKRFHENTTGKGIGLYLVKSQIESLNGFIEIESAVDVGSTFTVGLKLESDQEQ